jgi:hypothetical protein
MAFAPIYSACALNQEICLFSRKSARLIIRSTVIVIDVMASVAKWLRQWIVVPPLGGSIPLVRPTVSLEDSKQVETFRRSFAQYRYEVAVEGQ